MYDLGTLYLKQKRIEEAESLFRKSLVIGEMAMGVGNIKLIQHLHQLALIATLTFRYDQVENSLNFTEISRLRNFKEELLISSKRITRMTLIVNQTLTTSTSNKLTHIQFMYSVNSPGRSLKRQNTKKQLNYFPIKWKLEKRYLQSHFQTQPEFSR